VETADNDKYIKLSFLNSDDVIPMPNEIFCYDITETKIPHTPIPGVDFFILTYPNKYVFYYVTKLNNKVKQKIIYMIDCHILKSVLITNYCKITERDRWSQEFISEFARNMNSEDFEDEELNEENDMKTED
jgi:hypothetical protein